MPDRDRGTVPGSVGRLMPNTELRVVGGELWVRGPQVMAGYLNRPEATAEILDRDGGSTRATSATSTRTATSSWSTASRS